MSPKKDVQYLKQICLNTIVEEILFRVNTTKENLLRTMQVYIAKNSTFSLITDILKVVLASSQITSKEKYLCLKSLLRNDVTQLDCSNFSPSYHKKILNEIITAKITGIQHLVLTNFALEDCDYLLPETLRVLNNLRSLIIPNIANDECIEVIKTLKFLYCLDISGNVNFSEKQLENLASNSIQILSIGQKKTSATTELYLPSIESIAILIKNLPNLRALQVYKFGGKAVQKLHEQDETVKTKLCYIRDKNSTPETITALVKLCPNLQSIELDSPSQDCVKNLKFCRDLKCLKLIAAIKNELVNYLSDSGTKLSEINLERVSDIELSDILSSNVVVLRCTEMSITFTQKKISCERYKNLCDFEFLSCDISDLAVKLILSNSLRIRRFAIGGDTNLTHTDVLQVCETNPLSFLEELWLSNAKFLTAVTVKHLIEHCRSLKLIGQLSCWDIEREEINYLRFHVFVTNTSVKLLYFPSLTFRI